jgi:hypothetical protein
VDVRPPLVAYREPAVTGEPRQRRALHHPPVPSELLAGVDPTSGDARFYAPLARSLAPSREILGLVGMQLGGALTRSLP